MYGLPLRDGITVAGFKYRVGTKPALRCWVKEKKTRPALSDAELSNVDLPTQAPESPDLFSARVGKVLLGETIFVEVIYIGELKHGREIEGLQFTIPTLVAPRYTLEDFSETEWDAMNQPPDHRRIRITADIILPAGEHIARVESPSHMIPEFAVSRGTISTASEAAPATNKAFATLWLRSDILEKEFVLLIRSRGPKRPKALLEAHPTLLHSRAMVVTLLAPSSSFSSYMPSEIVLVADRSTNMEKDIPVLISTMNVFLKSLPTRVRFNVCSFGTERTFLWTESKIYTKSTLQEAIQHISEFKANHGRTKIFEAIQVTIKRRLANLPLDIILFTNGDTTEPQSCNVVAEQGRNAVNEEALFRSVRDIVQEKKQETHFRLFPVGVGDNFSRSLVEGMAKAGQGYFVPTQDQERSEKSVTRMLRAVLSPHDDIVLQIKYGQDDDDFELVDGKEATAKLSSLEFENATDTLPAPGSSIDNKHLQDSHHFPQIIQAPHKISSLSVATTKENPTIYILMGPETIRKNPTSMILLRPYAPALEFPIEILPQRGITIHHLGARRAIHDLEQSRGWVFDDEITKITDPQNLAKNETVRLGEAFQVVNKWCSFGMVSSVDGKEAFPQDIQQSGIGVNTADPWVDLTSLPLLIPGVRWQMPPPPPARKEGRSPDTVANTAQTQRRLSPVRAIGGPPSRQFLERRVKRRAKRLEEHTRALADALAVKTSTLHRLTKALDLIGLQCFDGAWNLADEERLLDIMGLKIPRPLLSGVSEEAWVTMLVVSFLEDKMPEEEDVWGLVVEKARVHVRKYLEIEALAPLEKLAGDAIGAGKLEG